VIGGGESLRHALLLSSATGIEASRVYGIVLVGGPDGPDPDDVAFCREKGIREIPHQKDWASFFAAHPTQSVMFALPHGAYHYLEDNLDLIADQVPDIKLIPDILKYTRFSAGIEMIRGIPVINIHESPLAGIGSIIKRTLDIVGAGI